MARLARVVVPGVPHHLTQRGNRKGDIFFDDSDRRRFLAFLAEQRKPYDISIWAYCLMTNHVHLVVVPSKSDKLGHAIRQLTSCYASYLNNRKGWTGHVWQGRFFSTPLDELHLWSAVHYVERNPVRAGLVKKAEDYPWSSAASHCGLRKDPVISGGLEKKGVIEGWSGWLAEGDETSAKLVRDRTKTGRPCGTKEFVQRLERTLERQLTPGRRGPKPRR